MMRVATILSIATVACLSSQASAQWWNPLAPSDYEECAEKAAKEGKTAGGLSILLQACNTTFPARRDKSGKGYIYYDSQMSQSIKVDSPSLSDRDKKRIEEAHQEHLKREKEKCLDLNRQRGGWWDDYLIDRVPRC